MPFRLVPLFLLPALLFLAGCAKQPGGPKGVDAVKSCEALAYERKQVNEALEATRNRPPEKEENGIKYAVVAAGGLLSFHPELLSGPYFYLLPALTVWYYNTAIRHDDRTEARLRLEKRLETLETLIEERPCTPTR